MISRGSGFLLERFDLPFGYTVPRRALLGGCLFLDGRRQEHRDPSALTAGRLLDLADVRYVNAVATSRLDPDLTILVDIAVDEIERRKGASGIPFDRMESAGRAFYERVREGYLALAAEQPGRYVRVNGMGTVEAVEAEVWGAFRRRFSVKHQTL